MTRTFTMRDQAAFAAFSGDANPMHTDPTEARRMLYGRPVTHGMHLVLWAMDALVAPGGPFGLAAIKVRFHGPVPVDEPAELEHRRDGDRHRISVLADGRLRTAIDLTVRPATAGSAMPPTACPPPDCSVLTPEAVRGAEGRFPVAMDPAVLGALFPRLAETLDPAQLAALAALSRLVGMHCPGLHSVFSGFEATASDDGDPQCRWEVTRFDDRFSLAQVAFSLPGLTGTLQAFLRPRPEAQAASADVAPLVGPDEFAHLRALVVGGSRGIGEATAKLLAAGGAQVRLTYSRGKRDADRVCAEIRSAGGICSALACDVNAPDPAVFEEPVNALFYYATPPIFQGAAGRFSTRLFRRFADVYVDGFLRLLEGLPKEDMTVLYPSSTALDELPPDMGEYVAAKSAGEALCAFLTANRGNLTIHAPRLPRLRTDQTASLTHIRNREPVEILLPLLREHFKA